MLRIMVSPGSRCFCGLFIVVVFSVCQTDADSTRTRDNECESGAHDCDIHAECTDTKGSFECTCNFGFFDSSLTTWRGPGARGSCQLCTSQAVSAGSCSWCECAECLTNSTEECNGNSKPGHDWDKPHDGHEEEDEDEDEDLGEDQNTIPQEDEEVTFKTIEIGEDDSDSNTLRFTATLLLSLEAFDEPMLDSYLAGVAAAGGIEVAQACVKSVQEATTTRRASDAIAVLTQIDSLDSSLATRAAIKSNLWFQLNSRDIDLQMISFHASEPGGGISGVALGAIIGGSVVGGLAMGMLIAMLCFAVAARGGEKRSAEVEQAETQVPSGGSGTLVFTSEPNPSAPELPSRGVVLTEMVSLGGGHNDPIMIDDPLGTQMSEATLETGRVRPEHGDGSEVAEVTVSSPADRVSLVIAPAPCDGQSEEGEEEAMGEGRRRTTEAAEE